MRLNVFAWGAALLAAMAITPLLRAQFQAPNPDELKMTSDPQAPGAAAVYLDREEITDNELNVRSSYARIKVLTERGKELATVRIPYLPGNFATNKIEGRTIHADGAIVPLNVKPEDIMEFKTKYFQLDTLVFNLPSVEVGSILEYRVEFQSYGFGPPTWEIQLPYYIHKEHFLYAPGTLYGTLYNGHGKSLDRVMCAASPANAPIAVQYSKRHFTIDMTDVPPQPDEDWMPPMNTIKWRAEFYFTYARTEQEFWDTEAGYWTEAVENFAKVTGTIKKASASLFSPGDSDEQKARKIYAAVMKLDNTDFSRVRSEAERKKEKLKAINRVEDVWKNQSGSGDEIALLYVALARAAGLKVWPMHVVDRSRAIFDFSYLSTRQLDDYIAIIEIDGKEVYLDPGQKECPFGKLEWTHTLTRGFRESAAGPVLAMTPAPVYKDSVVQRIADLTVDAEGKMTGSVRIVFNGADALYWRQKALENDAEELKRLFEDSLNVDLPDGVQATFDHFLGIDDYESNLMAFFKVGGMIGVATGKRFLLPGFFFESRAKHPFIAQDKRLSPIDVHFPLMEADDVTYRLPAGFAVESAPKVADADWPQYAILHANSDAEDGAVTVKRIFARNFALLAAENYKNLHDFYLKVAAADQQQIVLERTSAAKGN